MRKRANEFKRFLRRYKARVLKENRHAKCPYCNELLSEKDLVDISVDHVTPISLGGSKKNIKNMIVCCVSCNDEKANLFPLEFIANKVIGTKIRRDEIRGLYLKNEK